MKENKANDCTTVEDLKAAKKNAEEKILDMLSAIESTYGVNISGVRYETKVMYHGDFTSHKSRHVSVDISI